MNTNNQELKPKTFRFDNKFRIYAITSLLLLQTIFLLGKTIETNIYIRTLIALLPVIPFVFALFNLASMIRTEDELSKKIIADALSLTFCITLTWTLAGALLQHMIGIPKLSFMIIFAVVMASFCISYLIVSRNYK